MSTEPCIELELDGATAIVWLNRPAVRNALDRYLIDDFDRAVEQLRGCEEVRVVVLAGRGEGFCAGADLREIKACSSDEARALELHCAEVFEQLAALPVVLIAALHGFAVGGGFSLAVYCDLRVVARGTKLGFPTTARHWLPPWGLSRLAGWTGVSRAEQILLTAGVFDAERAYEWGLVDHLVDPAEVMPVACRLAESLQHTRRDVVAEVRSFFSQLRGRPHRQWDRIAAKGFHRLFATSQTQAALNEFLDRGTKHRAEDRRT